jgi:hypothetical protein
LALLESLDFRIELKQKPAKILNLPAEVCVAVNQLIDPEPSAWPGVLGHYGERWPHSAAFAQG